MDSESVIHDELSQYKVIEHLESIDPDEYHTFLYHLLNHFKGASVALEFLFNEILRYEPAASPLIQKLREILIILSNLGFMHSWSEFIAFSSQPPFTLHVDEQRFTDFLRREITESSLTKLRSVCSLLSIPASTAFGSAGSLAKSRGLGCVLGGKLTSLFSALDTADIFAISASDDEDDEDDDPDDTATADVAAKTPVCQAGLGAKLFIDWLNEMGLKASFRAVSSLRIRSFMARREGLARCR